MYYRKQMTVYLNKMNKSETMNTPVIIETHVNSNGEYEGSKVIHPGESESDHWQASNENSKFDEPLNAQKGQSYFIDINDLHAGQPIWAEQANQIFSESIEANATGIYSEYMQQVKSQFDQMTQQLQQQMNQYTKVKR